MDSALQPGHFFASAGQLSIEERPQENWRWEVLRGHLLDAAHTRETAVFDAWHVALDAAGQESTPLILVLLDAPGVKLHVVRRILVHAFEAYEDSPGVILSRPVEKWTAELVSTIRLEHATHDHVEAELRHALFWAIVGTSRLPITSLESPLPAYSFGQLAYLPSLRGKEFWHDAAKFLEAALGATAELAEQARALEVALRDERCEIEHVATVLARGPGREQNAAEQPFWAGLFRELFQTVALSPYTSFADRLVALLARLGEQPAATSAAADVFGYMLRRLCRHLTSFDLVTFHNYGANYPDALFLDALLAGCLRLVRANPELIESKDDDAPLVARVKRLRRRGLRQGAILRIQYEGLPVPDAPTSVGENARVLPGTATRVPDEQITSLAARQRRLFEGPSTREVLGPTGNSCMAQCVRDLDDPRELAELGRGLFLDRPLGSAKEPGEVDRTPLLSYEAVSPSIMAGRLALLRRAGWLQANEAARLLELSKLIDLRGITLRDFSPRERPGVVSLSDLGKGTGDFVLERTTRGSLISWLPRYDWSVLGRISAQAQSWLEAGRDLILVQHAPMSAPLDRPTLRIYDRTGELRVELGFLVEHHGSVRYRERQGLELPERLSILMVAGFDRGMSQLAPGERLLELRD
ncbi:MAG TPA: hypothetical protein VL175_01505 [Pirellulales bacterium]|nr:hypothetical protein [Pirellulales bacterium]